MARFEPTTARKERKAVATGRCDVASAALAEWIAAAPDDPKAHLIDGRI